MMSTCFAVYDFVSSHLPFLMRHFVFISSLSGKSRKDFEEGKTEVTAAGNDNDHGMIAEARAAETVPVPAPAAVVSCKYKILLTEPKRKSAV